MEMDPSSGHQQIMSSDTLETMLACSKASQEQEQEQEQNKKARPQPEQALKCPRCDSTNTKFCYYNNYSLSQPRYFCKSCRRYWTKGGTLRNVPVGGGCRKNKRSSSTSSSSSKRVGQDQPFINTNYHHNPLSGFPNLSCYDSTSDFTLAIAARLQQKGHHQQFGTSFDHHDHHDLSILGNTIGNTPCDNILGLNNINSAAATTTTGFLDAIRNNNGLFLGSTNNNNNNIHQNLYYDYGNHSNNNNNGDMGEVVDNGSGDMNMVIPYNDEEQEMSTSNVATTQAVTVTTMKQEICLQNSDNNNNNKVLWGFPWQINNGGETTIMGHHHHEFELSSARATSCWNNLNSSSWHGLLNTTPLM